MIQGIGVDIVEIARIENLLNEFGERFANRILTSDELDEFNRRKRPSAYLATRFAAKEAVAKALGTGIGKDIGFQTVQVYNDEKGKPTLRFLGHTAELIRQRDINSSMISLSDEKHYVVAMVIMESY